jgi:hypothetical protein
MPGVAHERTFQDQEQSFMFAAREVKPMAVFQELPVDPCGLASRGSWSNRLGRQGGKAGKDAAIVACELEMRLALRCGPGPGGNEIAAINTACE